MAALYLLNIYNRNEILYCKYKEIKNLDYSFGSKIFSIVVPSFENDNECKASYSPYIASFAEEGIYKILELEENKKDYLYKLFLNQPEIKDKNRLKYVFEDLDYFSISQLSINDAFKHLGKYRIREKYRTFDSYQEKIDSFLSSNEINGEMYKKNKKIKDEELNESNIDSAIDLAGDCYGLEIMNQYINQYIKEIWIPMSKNEQICEIIIPE